MSRATGGAAETVRVMFHRNFGPYFLGNFLSMCGTWFQNLAQTILIYRLTGSALLVGVVNFALFAGVFLMFPWSGPAADRFDRRRLLALTQTAAVLITGTLAILAAAGRAGTWVVIGLVLVLGLSGAFAIPARQAFIAALVPRKQLPSAIALNSVTFNLARTVGPVVAAFVVDTYGVSWAFGFNSLSYLALIAALWVVTPRPEEDRPPQRPRLLDGVRLVRRDPNLTTLFLVVSITSIASDPVSTLMPAFSTLVYDRADTFSGILIGVFGAGAVTAAFVFGGRSHPSFRRLGVTVGMLGAGVAVLAATPSVTFGIAGLFIGGFGFLATMTSATATLQLEVPDHQRGRIMALWSVAFLGVRPLASLLDGAVATALGVRAGAAVMAAPALLVALGLLLSHQTPLDRVLPGRLAPSPGEDL